MKTKRLLSVILAVLMLASVLSMASVSVSAEVDSDAQPAIGKDYALGETVNDGLILQAWNWSYNEIKNNLEAIAEAGFTTIQISPPTELKETTKGVKILQEDNANGWWMMYQPAAFEINQSEDNALGTKNELKDMISSAHELGLYVIADAVINHLGNNETADYKINANTIPKDANAVDYLCERAWDFESSKAIIDAGVFHYPYANCKYTDQGSFDCTQNAVSLLPDLDTGSPVVQEIVLDYWQECIDIGIDGFRIDAAKHIETKYDGEYASDFWDNLMYNGVNGKQGIYPYAKDKYGKDLYMYGEILNTTSTERSFTWYLEYMNITNSTAFYAICDAVNNGTAANAVPESFNNGMTNQTAVLWDESHDTYMDGCKTRSIPGVNLLTKRWACMASRADVVSMYLARPTDTPADVYSIDLGVASDTAWNDDATVAINKFHNHFQGTSEAVSSSGNIAIIERGNAGVVLVNCRGNAVNANVPVTTLSDGTYVDQISGNVFTVSDGKISGSIGTSGVAVVYNPDDVILASTVESCKFTADTLSVDIIAKNTDEAFYTVNGREPIAFSGIKTLTFSESDFDTASSEVEVFVGYLGDADQNGIVNVRDVTSIQKYSANLETYTETQIRLANVNLDADKDGNPTVNVKDATAIQKQIASIDSGCEIDKEIIDNAQEDLRAVTLKLIAGDKTATYCYEQISEDEATWVKYDNSETMWTHVYCYVFKDEPTVENNAWPGILMQEREDNIWYYEIPEELRGGTVIFSNNILGTSEQTGNLPTSNAETGENYSNHFIFTGGKWNAIEADGTYTEIKEQKSGYYIVFTDVYNWAGTKYSINCYTWNGGPAMSWPGVKMELIGTNDQGQKQYAAWIDRGCVNIIFNNGSNKQTADLLVVKGDCGYYPLSNKSKPDCGTFEVEAP
ncbi:MAG: starch-binding protein [Ruminococcus sp.]